MGIILVTGDVFECEEDIADPESWRSLSQFPLLQEKSRNSVIIKADTIIPGHGKLFKVAYTYTRQIPFKLGNFIDINLLANFYF